MKIAIAIFVKTPGISPLKTRLAATIGEKKAVEFYRQSLKCLIATLKETKQRHLDITSYWAVGEKQGLDDPLWSDFKRLHTRDGDLGDRQNHIYHTLLKKYDAVMLIGADAPQLSQQLFQQAINQLQSDEFVIGPANDGGYYLLAGRREISSHIWSETPWSDPDTREILSAKLPTKPFELKRLTDVDTISDLQKIPEEMPKEANQAQIDLINWITHL